MRGMVMVGQVRVMRGQFVSGCFVMVRCFLVVPLRRFVAAPPHRIIDGVVPEGALAAGIPSHSRQAPASPINSVCAFNFSLYPQSQI
jgi:hypothetical protein